jgi:hypothetical protein
MKNLMQFILPFLLLSGCNFSKSVNIDLISGLTTKGDQISCENVSVSVDDQAVNRSSFMYGETFSINFSGVEGLKTENGKVFPGMEFIVRSAAGDTILANSDIYSDYESGISLSPLVLSATLTAASPLHSGGDYTLNLRMWDKKDRGTFSAVFKFTITPNEKIAIEKTDGVSCSELYLLSKETGKVINDNVVKVNDETYLLFEGLTGFTGSDDRVFPGLSMKATGADGELLMNYEDMFSDYTVTGIDAEEFQNQVLTKLNFNTADIKNPIHLSVTIWDKKGKASISALTDLKLVN